MAKTDILKQFKVEAEKLLKKSKSTHLIKVDASIRERRNKKALIAQRLYERFLFVNLSMETVIEETSEIGNKQIDNVVSAIEASGSKHENVEGFIKRLNEVSKYIFKGVKTPVEGLKKQAFSQEVAKGAVKTFSTVLTSKVFEAGKRDYKWSRLIIALCYYYSAPFKSVDFVVEQKADLLLADLTEKVSAAYTEKVVLAIPEGIRRFSRKAKYNERTKRNEKLIKKAWLKKVEADSNWHEKGSRTSRAKALKKMLEKEKREAIVLFKKKVKKITGKDKGKFTLSSGETEKIIEAYNDLPTTIESFRKYLDKIEARHEK